MSSENLGDSTSTIVEAEPQKTQKDGILEILEKTLDPNKYATKKTIAQGLLDVALLTANASQLKYILQVGPKHEFYTLMLSLIIVSIILQLAVAILFVIIGGLNINKDRNKQSALVLNDIILVFIFLIAIIVQGTLCIFLGVRLDINDNQDHSQADKVNNFVVLVNFLLMGVNIVINTFDMKSSDSGT